MLELLFPIIMTLPIIVLFVSGDFHIEYIFIILSSVALWTIFMLWGYPRYYERERNECKLKHQGVIEYVSVGKDSIRLCKSGEAYYKIEIPQD